MDYGKEFKKYAVGHIGLNSLTTEDVIKHQVISGGTPYILEERQLNMTQIDVFSRLMKDRILFLTGAVNQEMADVIQAQLLFLDSVEKKDITMMISSPGGSVVAGLSIIDVMKYVKSDISTVNLGMAASMGSCLLSSGAKGKRSSLVFSKVMIHHVSSGTGGTIDDQRISIMESEKYNFILFKLLAENCGKTFDEVHDISQRDKWFNSQEALEYGLIDEIIGVSEGRDINTYMDGFDDYYKKYVMKS